MTKPERARERYQLEIRLIEEEVEPLTRGEKVALVLLALVRLDGFAREMNRTSLPPKGPQPRLITISDRATGNRLKQFAVDAGDEGQAIVHAINHEYKRDDADPWADRWLHANP